MVGSTSDIKLKIVGIIIENFLLKNLNDLIKIFVTGSKSRIDQGLSLSSDLRKGKKNYQGSIIN